MADQIIIASELSRTTPTSKPVIRLENVFKTYDLGEIQVQALRGVSLEISEGEFVAVMGPSGSGKSTIMNILGCLFQQFNLLSRTSALENVELPTVYAGISPDERAKRAMEALTRVGLAERSGHHPSQLSGGQQQRVAIARGLVNRPSILLADEPTGNLDSRTSVEILEVFQKLNGDGLTIVLVTHEPDIAEFAKRGIHFKDGTIRRDEAVQNRPVAAEVLKNMPALED